MTKEIEGERVKIRSEIEKFIDDFLSQSIAVDDG